MTDLKNAIVHVIPVRYPELVQLKVRLLDNEGRTTKEAFLYESMPWSAIRPLLTLDSVTLDNDEHALQRGDVVNMGAMLLHFPDAPAERIEMHEDDDHARTSGN